MSEPEPLQRPRVRTALFVDFENILIGLQRLDAGAAHRFATDPSMWVEWIGGLTYPALAAGGPVHREVLIRYCYLNPVTSGRYRAHFTRAGFRVVDCPPLTGAGKNSADIHIVIDVLDLLAHPVRYDEVVLLSADADYTPVMLRLRAHDRRVVIITSGPSAPAFRAACDHVVPEDVFIDHALAVEPPEEASTQDEVPPDTRTPTDLPPRVVSDTEKAQLRRRVASTVHKAVAASDQPVVLASAAHMVRAHLGDAIDGWAGAGSFKKLLASIDLSGLLISDEPPSYIFDPARHQLPTGEPADDAADVDLMTRVSRVTDLPRLGTHAYRTLFEHLAIEVDAHGFNRNSTARAVRDSCVEAGESVPRSAVNFVLNGLAYVGRTPRPGDTPVTLAAVFADNTINLCQNARMELSPDEIDTLRSMINPWNSDTTATSGQEGHLAT